MQGPRPKREGPSKAQESAAAALASVVDLFESGELPERIAETVIRRQESDAPCATWSLGNQLLTVLAGTADARGYRQWQETWRHVKKGSKAFYILAPIKRKRSETDTETGETRESFFLTGFKPIPVFRYEDTEGPPLEEPDYTPATFPPLFDVAERLGVKVSYLPYVDRFKGYYRPSDESIVLCSTDCRVFFHELAHAAHRRVLQARGTDLKAGQVATQEIVAETVAATLCRLYGFDGYLYSGAEYVKAYGKDNPGRAAMRVLADVQATLTLILATADAVDVEQAA